MTDSLTDRFEAHRAHLRAVAYRMLGTTAEADDAVQEAWLRMHRADTEAVDNLGGWLTTVVARVCLDQLRASQINGCGACCDLHARHMRAAGETPERLAAVADWRHTPYFTDAERAALALTESLTRLADRDDPVPDAVWSAAAQHHDESSLAALVVAIANINVWNRLNAAVGQIAGSW